MIFSVLIISYSIPVDTKCIIDQTPFVLHASGKHVPKKPHLHIEKTGVCRGIHNFLIFDPKHTLWVLVRTAAGTC